jgi:hypothetical protein
MTRRRKRRARPRVGYRSTPIPGLFLHPVVLLLNLIVRSAEDNAKTDGLIPVETVDRVTALIRHAYDFPDLDRSRGEGVLISLIGQFFHPDDYVEHRIAKTHSQAILRALQGDLQPQTMESPDLRTSNVPDPAALSQDSEKRLSLHYKQRFLSFCFIGQSAQLDELRGDVSTELLNHILGTVWHELGISDESFVVVHPSFVPARRVRAVSVQNALQWAELVKQLMDEGKADEMMVIGPPGPSYIVRPKKPPSRKKKR